MCLGAQAFIRMTIPWDTDDHDQRRRMPTCLRLTFIQLPPDLRRALGAVFIALHLHGPRRSFPAAASVKVRVWAGGALWKRAPRPVGMLLLAACTAMLPREGAVLLEYRSLKAVPAHLAAKCHACIDAACNTPHAQPATGAAACCPFCMEMRNGPF